jgi:ABC-type phosphate transport system substrate-binding protein
MFNTPVTLTLRNTLQSLQFPAGSVCNPSNAAYNSLTASTTDRADTTNAESEACMPSLSRAEINSLLTGKILTWDTLDPGLPAQDVIVCRRVNGSGSQATLNALVSSWPCDVNQKDNSINIINPMVPDGTFVIGNSGSGDVSNCLNSRSAGYAIGVLSVEGRNNGNTLGWRYIKVDGVAPTLNNAHNGDYWFWAQQSCQRRNAALPYNVDGGRPNDTIANKDRLFDALCGPTATRGLNSLDALTKLNNPLNGGATCGTTGTVTANTCQSFYTWGQAGWLATPTTSLLFDQALNTLTRPVNAYTREVAVGSPNICQTPVKSDVGNNSLVPGDVTPNPNWTP